MYNVRESWTDERLDDFRGEVNRRFDAVDKRFDKVDHELNRVNDRLDGLNKAIVFAVLTLGSSTIAGWAAVIAFVVTRT
jgi:tetrahydromethanopterin S-methyltransferase subunit G